MDTHYINEVIKGNTNAFGYFIRTYQNKAFGIAISIVKQEDDAKDVVQSSFITAYASISEFRNDAKFSTWFYRIVVNTGLQFLAQRKRNSIKNEALELSATEKTACNTVIKKMHQDDLKHLVKSVFGKIPSKQALLLQLFYIDELSIAEIEVVTNLTKPNIKVLLHRGRTNFYNIVKKEHIKKTLLKMEDKDQLKDILSHINHINEPIDLEASIMQSIRKEELTKQKITSYRKQGIRGLIVSFVLVIVLVCIYSFSKSFQTLESACFKYASIVACLILLFAQLELGGLQFINQFKNNKS